MIRRDVTSHRVQGNRVDLTSPQGLSRLLHAETLTAWREQHLYSLFSSLGRLSARFWSSLMTVVVMGFALALPLLFFLIVENSRQFSSGLREAREISVFLNMGLSAEASQAVRLDIQQRSDVESVILRSPEQGLREFKQLAGFSQALDVLVDNPLPYALIVTPKDVPESEKLTLVETLQEDTRVDLVQYDAKWRQRLWAISVVMERTFAVLAGLLGLAALLVVGNTVRLDIQNRAEEIAVMQLIGASHAFVRRPFLYAGLWYGLAAGVLAVGVVYGVEWTMTESLISLSLSYQERFTLRGLSAIQAVVVIVLSTGLGWLGAWMVSSYHLASGRPRS